MAISIGLHRRKWAYTFGGLVFLLTILMLCSGRKALEVRRLDSAQTFHAVNLGGWLVNEGWIKPCLFDGIPDNDLLDGTQIQLKSVKLGTYVVAEGGGGQKVAVNRANASTWETFRIWRVKDGSYQLRVLNKQFIGADNGGGGVVNATANAPSTWETFQIIRNPADRYRVHIQALNGMYLQAETQDQLTADFQGQPGWDDNNAATFNMTIVGIMRGEYQITNGYGPERARQVLNDHWNGFITEDDFVFLSNNGINAVRIPVGWWIASDPNPPAPFVGGSLEALDKAFTWAQTHGIKVIIDLHAAPGSQNGDEHSGSRDGSIEWPTSQDNINTSLSVIDFLAARYFTHHALSISGNDPMSSMFNHASPFRAHGNNNRYAGNPALLGVELLNEPRAPAVDLETLTTYYSKGYATVRKHSCTAYVIMCNRVGPANPKELFQMNNGLSDTVVDIHYYNLFDDSLFKNMTVQHNIDYINNNRSSTLQSLSTNNGPLIIVGEWVAEWEVQGASKSDYQRFGDAQLEVYRQASFGWAYWTLKNVQNHWSFEWMVQNQYLRL